MIKPKPWKGTDLKGTWEVTLKIDGARMLRDEEGNPVSRSGKPLYNLEGVPDDITDAEIYKKDWETSMGLVRTSVNGSPVPLDCVYSLEPLDTRLHVGYIVNPTKDLIERTLDKSAVSRGYEGLILRQGDRWLKVKPKDTCDVYVTGFQKGANRLEGIMGALLTNYGKVGTGFSDKQREEWQTLYDQGNHKVLIEIEFMEWTKNGIMRHPRFIRIRDDKTEESLGEAYEAMFRV